MQVFCRSMNKSLSRQGGPARPRASQIVSVCNLWINDSLPLRAPRVAILFFPPDSPARRALATVIHRFFSSAANFHFDSRHARS